MWENTLAGKHVSTVSSFKQVTGKVPEGWRYKEYNPLHGWGRGEGEEKDGGGVVGEEDGGGVGGEGWGRGVVGEEGGGAEWQGTAPGRSPRTGWEVTPAQNSEPRKLQPGHGACVVRRTGRSVRRIHNLSPLLQSPNSSENLGVSPHLVMRSLAWPDLTGRKNPTYMYEVSIYSPWALLIFIQFRKSTYH